MVVGLIVEVVQEMHHVVKLIDVDRKSVAVSGK